MMALLLPSPPLNLDKHSSSSISVYQKIVSSAAYITGQTFLQLRSHRSYILACHGTGALGVSATRPPPSKKEYR
jgi:hypothetical protein